jgi:hypothetical protein
MKALCLAAVSVGLAACSVLQPARAAEGARTVKGHVLTSTETPAVHIEFPADFKYVGTQDFILYDVARAEQHFFVDADAEGRVKRFYWIQFEGYLPSNTYTYDYESKQTVTIGGLEFIADAFPVEVEPYKGKPDSDGARARAFLKSKGYSMASNEVAMQRLVHLVDATKRSELMIIYAEPLGEPGLDAASLEPGGRAADKWPEISKALLDRATKGLKITR